MKQKRSEQRNLSNRLAGVTLPISRKRTKWGRNWPCLCGSGKKYKKCCINEINNITTSDGNANVESLPEDIQKMIDARQEKGNG